MSIKRTLLQIISNLPGWHTKRKIIVFLTDDWGGVRVHSNEARQNLIMAGIEMDGNRFDRFDTLESNDDMEALFEVLLNHKDHKGNHPVITAVANVANPDFEKIKNNNFTKYFYEPYTETLKRYPNHDKVFELYKKGIELNIFKPELHGREHLQVKWWLENLKAGNKMVQIAFENEFWHLGNKYLSNPLHRSLGAAYDIASIDEVEKQKGFVTDGARLFEELFGYKSTLFIPPAQHYHQNLEPAMVEAGFSLVDVPRYRKMPLGNGKFKTKLHFMGQKGQSGLRYLTRNVVFEPNLNPNDDGVQSCLKGIETAFKFRQPAIISNHRAAFVSGLNIDNRDKGIKALDRLIKLITKRWPESEFIPVSDLYKLIQNSR